MKIHNETRKNTSNGKLLVIMNDFVFCFSCFLISYYAHVTFKKCYFKNFKKREGQEGRLQRDTRKLLGMIDIFIVLIVMASWTYTHVKTYQTVHFKCMYFIVCLLYLSEVVKVIGWFVVFFFFFHLKNV